MKMNLGDHPLHLRGPECHLQGAVAKVGFIRFQTNNLWNIDEQRVGTARYGLIEVLSILAKSTRVPSSLTTVTLVVLLMNLYLSG